jgi:molybdate-binding protein/DNA-binding PadR family transcriptional regulator
LYSKEQSLLCPIDANYGPLYGVRSREANRMPLAHALLALLSRGERHGYELRRELEREFGPDWRIDFGQLYRELARMEREGWVKARSEIKTRGPARKVRSITPSGRRELARWAGKTVAPARRRDELSVWRRFVQTPDGAVGRALVAIGNDDFVLQLLARTLAVEHPQIRFEMASAASIAGLNALREGQADLAGIHLLDLDSGEYNIPYVKYLLPEDSIVLVTLAHREQGLLLAPGNPLNVRGVRDLARRPVRLINRRRGAGTRLLLYHALRRARVDPSDIKDYNREAPTHDALAATIASGNADAGPGIRAAAEKWHLSFVPLGEERYDLAIPRTVFESPQLRPLLEVLHNKAFRRSAGNIPGYDVSRLGTIVART